MEFPSISERLQISTKSLWTQNENAFAVFVVVFNKLFVQQNQRIFPLNYLVNY